MYRRGKILNDEIDIHNTRDTLVSYFLFIGGRFDADGNIRVPCYSDRYFVHFVEHIFTYKLCACLTAL